MANLFDLIDQLGFLEFGQTLDTCRLQKVLKRSHRKFFRLKCKHYNHSD